MTTDKVTHRLVTTDFLTPSYRIVGKVMTPNTGLTGLMNDTTNSFMEILEAKLARVHMPTKLVGEYNVLNLVKPNIFAVCLTRREDLGPQALARGGFQKILKYPVKIATPVYELEGVIEWPGRFDFAAIMVEGIRDFLPIYDATLTAILIPQLKIESPAILFNRRHVDWLGLLSETK